MGFCHKEDILTRHWPRSRAVYPTYPHSVLSHTNKRNHVKEIGTKSPEIFRIKWKLRTLGFFHKADIHALALQDPMLIIIDRLVFFLLSQRSWKKLYMCNGKVIWWTITYSMSFSQVFEVNFQQTHVCPTWQISLNMTLLRACILVWLCWVFRRLSIQSIIWFDRSCGCLFGRLV